MSAKHPIIAITGSSGAGTTSVMRAFEQNRSMRALRGKNQENADGR